MAIAIKPVQDKLLWESFLAGYGPNALFQSWPWGQVQQKLGQSVWRVGAYDSSGLVGIAQIVKVAAGRGPFLHVRHGPVVAGDDPKPWKALLTFCKNLGHQEGCWFIRISPLVGQSPFFDLIMRWGQAKPAAINAIDAEVCWVLDLRPPLATLLANMRKTTRYEIKKAQAAGVKVIKTTSPRDFKHFLALYAQTAKRQAFVPHQGLTEEFEIFTHAGSADLFVGRFEGRPTAGALVLYYAGQAIYHHGASIPSKVSVSTLIQWKAIATAKERGLHWYNFWGIAPTEDRRHPWYGLTQFKKGFGGEERRYAHAHDLPIHPFYVASRAIELLRKTMKGY